MDAVTIDTVVQLARANAWIPLLAAIVGLLTRLSKSDVTWWFLARVNTKPEQRALWAMGLAVVGAALDRLVAGGTWYDALAGGVVAGSGAIAGHEIIVNGLRNGRDFGVKKLPPPPPTPWADDSERPPVNPSPRPPNYPLAAATIVLAMIVAVVGCAAGKAIACPLLDLSAKVCPLVPVIMADGSQELVPRDRIADVAMRVRTERIAAEAKTLPCPKCTDGGTE